MEIKRKKQIDDIWRKSDFGKWCNAVAKNDRKEAERINKKMFNAGYVTIEVAEYELAARIAKKMHSEKEFEEYQHALDRENPDFFEVLLGLEFFDKISRRISTH
jgi:hypothetical protein